MYCSSSSSSSSTAEQQQLKKRPKQRRWSAILVAVYIPKFFLWVFFFLSLLHCSLLEEWFNDEIDAERRVAEEEEVDSTPGGFLVTPPATELTWTIIINREFLLVSSFSSITGGRSRRKGSHIHEKFTAPTHLQTSPITRRKEYLLVLFPGSLDVPFECPKSTDNSWISWIIDQF